MINDESTAALQGQNVVKRPLTAVLSPKTQINIIFTWICVIFYILFCQLLLIVRDKL